MIKGLELVHLGLVVNLSVIQYLSRQETSTLS